MQTPDYSQLCVFIGTFPSTRGGQAHSVCAKGSGLSSAFQPLIQQVAHIGFGQVMPAFGHYGNGNASQHAKGVHVGRNTLPVL